ncbi:MAG: tRNA (N6-isopentenyl adenosine(37)-C2)-methylthiotransferase MiaB [Clostridiales bacterium]|jgi:tRNA-2-methylthio-N6-dimethylallyladenosine synthase|nr:tRNA (N6-isopentenyl adenosine(37)-C2)-methylthiotransferase MiaB [Clostridiales bacterium]
MKKALVITYGCRQNLSDSEKIKGVLQNMNYEFCENPEDADLILFNTCAVRAGAEDRVYGNIGALKKLKLQNPGLIIAVCGCMTSQRRVAAKIKKSFPHVNLIFGTNSVHLLPQMLNNAENTHIFHEREDDDVYENIPSLRENKIVANLPIMFGCNNFCSYCVVPYVRGRERSRKTEDIINEARILAARGYKELQLLGQNVNSYSGDLNFPQLLSKLAKINGIERIRFISSHPKDFSPELISVMADNKKICKQLHLPFQSGSDRILKKMNRTYTRAHYVGLIESVRRAIPDIAISSDVIVGFPNEEQSDFEDTLSLINKLRLDMLFTFIYSKREGTPAAKMEPILSMEQTKSNFLRLTQAQAKISAEINGKLVGTVQDVLAEGYSKNNKDVYCGRTDGGKIVNFTSHENINFGDVLPIKIQNATAWALGGCYAERY